MVAVDVVRCILVGTTAARAIVTTAHTAIIVVDTRVSSMLANESKLHDSGSVHPGVNW